MPNQQCKQRVMNFNKQITLLDYSRIVGTARRKGGVLNFREARECPLLILEYSLTSTHNDFQRERLFPIILELSGD